MRWYVVCAALIVASASCRKDAAVPRLVTDQQLADLVNDATRKLADSRSKKCPRPVLRGTTRNGNWDEAIAKMATSTKAAITCRDVMGQVRKAISATLFQCPTKKPTGPDPDPMVCRARPPSDPAWKTDQIVAVDNACRALIEQLQVSVAHADACSPELPGRTAVEVASPVSTAVAAIVHAGRRAAGGKWIAGFELLLDTVRWLQDLNRGGGQLGRAQITSALLADLLGYAHDLLSVGPYTPTQLEVMARQIDQLIQTENRFHDLLVGTALQAADKNRWIEVMKGTGPGMPDRRPERTRAFASRADAIAIQWIILNTVSAELGVACPADATLDACATGLASARRQWAEKRRVLRERFDGRLEIGELLRQKRTPEELRADITDALRSGHQGSYRRRVVQFATRLADLAALRVHVELVRMAARTKKCPTLAALQKATAALRTPAHMGGTISIETAPAGGFFVRLPSWMAKAKRGGGADEGTSRPGPKLVHLECPKS